MSTYLAWALGLLAAVGTSRFHRAVRIHLLIVIPVGFVGAWLGARHLASWWWETVRHNAEAAELAGAVTGGIIAALVGAVAARLWRLWRAPARR